MNLRELYLQNHSNSNQSNNFFFYVIQNPIQTHHLMRMSRPPFRTVMVSVTYCGRNIKVAIRQPMTKAFIEQSIHRKITIFLKIIQTVV